MTSPSDKSRLATKYFPSSGLDSIWNQFVATEQVGNARTDIVKLLIHFTTALYNRANLVRKFLAVGLVLFPVSLLAGLGAVEDRLARRALSLGRLLTNGAYPHVFRIKLFN